MQNSALHRPSVVAIPVCNEVERIEACLEALDDQAGAQFSDIVLLINNSNDGTDAAAMRVALRPGTRLHCVNRTLPPHQATAGHARRLAMAAAARLAGPGGVLLTTDADARVDPDWLSANLAALDGGADAVAGWVELDPIEWGMIPAHLHEDDARECAYDSLCDQIHALLDPDPADPLPRHTQQSGASIAVTADAYAMTDGIPAIASGEDRAFLAALRQAGARIRHAPEVHVVVSGRVQGRSAGGMAETIRRRMDRPDDYIDDRLEPAHDCARRAFFRGRLRAAYGDPALFGALALELSMPELPDLCRTRPFEAAWLAIETQTTLRTRRMVAVADLAAETSAALRIFADIKAGAFDPTGRSGMPEFAPAGLE